MKQKTKSKTPATPSPEELRAEDQAVERSVRLLEEGMGAAKVAGVPVLPAMGILSILGGLLLPEDTTESRRAVKAGSALLSRHIMDHLCKGGALLERLPTPGTEIDEEDEKPDADTKGLYESFFAPPPREAPQGDQPKPEED